MGKRSGSNKSGYSPDYGSRDREKNPDENIGPEDQAYAGNHSQTKEDVETASDLTAMPSTVWKNEQRDAKQEKSLRDVGVALGVAGLVFALLSFFRVWPLLFSPLAILMGVLTIQRDCKTLGWWTLSLGAAALLFSVLTLPMTMLW
ncbi:hypothetical protein [Pasteuria penetrans]|uniref:hypothetical protein n=1 Tax=Pasteuria penetrans TaxID=86005 RepID=UPI0011EC714A|nr:hypothetical protein [Pasteuria penetrans]